MVKARHNKSGRKLLLFVFFGLLVALVFGFSSRYLKITVSSNDSDYPDNYNFVSESNLIEKKEKSIYFFSSTWCGPCSTIRKKLADIAKETENIQIYEVSSESGNSITGEYNVTTVPTVILSKENKNITVPGFDIEALDKLITQALIE